MKSSVIINGSNLDFRKRVFTNPPKLCEIIVKEFSFSKKEQGYLIEFLDGASDNKYKAFLNQSQAADLEKDLSKALNCCEEITKVVDYNPSDSKHRLYLKDNELIVNFPLKHSVEKEIFIFDKIKNIKAHSNSCGGCNRYNAHIMITFFVDKKENVPKNFPETSISGKIFLDTFLIKEHSLSLLEKLRANL